MVQPRSANVVAFRNGAAAPNRELEIKFEFGDEALQSLRAGLSSLGRTRRSKRLRAVYYDTADGALRKAGFVLRVRDEGSRRLQTVKADNGKGLFDRSEWETAVKSAAPDLAAARRTPLKSLLKRCGPLQPVFSTDIHRSIMTLRRDGCEVEAALDIGEIEAAGRRTPVRQLELELKGGDSGALFALAEQLAAQAPLRLTFETKGEIGYRLKSGEPAGALGSGPVGLTPQMTSGQAFAAAAGACLRQIVHNERVLRERRRPEALHQMRVGLRRLRTAIALFQPALGDVEAIVAELKWMAGVLDPGRDTDVFIAETYRPGAAVLGDAPGVAAFGRRLLHAQTVAYDDIVRALESRRGSDLTRRLAQWIEAGDWTGGADTLQAAARDQPAVVRAAEALGHLRRQVKRRGADLAALAPEARHKVRIKAKRLRYGLEFFAGVFPPKRTAAFVADLKGFQDSLGALNDVAFARRAASQLLNPDDKAQIGFAAGLVVALRTHDEAALLAAADRRLRAMLRQRAPWRPKT